MQDTIDLGTRRELLVDDFLIARMQGVHLQLQHPERREVAFALRLDPRLPRAWPSLGVTGIHWHDMVFDIEAAQGRITVAARENRDTDTRIALPEGEWSAELWSADGRSVARLSPRPVPPNSAETVFVVNWKSAAKVVFPRGAEL